MTESSPVWKKSRLSMESLDHEDQAHEQFIKDLGTMVNQDGCSDVTFICKDGVRVKGMRSLLVCRCIVLKRMLENGMRETSLSEINLPNISSQALLCVFEYLYTDTILIYQPKTWKLQFEVVQAAQYFLLNNLVGIVLDLMGITSEVKTDLSEVAAMLTVILEFCHSCQENSCDGIKRELVRILSSNWTHSVYASNLSEEAIHYLLSSTRQILQKEKREPSITEYYRFRQVILWWAYQNVPGWSTQAQEMVESAVPLIRDTSSLYFDVPLGIGGIGGIDEENTSNSSSLRLGLESLLKASRDSAMRLLSIIDLRYIHILLFEKVVKTFNCFSSVEIMRVFRFHALNEIQRTIRFSDPESGSICGWKHGTSLRVCGDGSSIEKSGCDPGTAIALMQMSSKNTIQLWRFAIGMDNKVSHVEVGFVFINADKVSRWGESDLNNMTLGNLPIAGAVGIISRRSKTYDTFESQGDSEHLGKFRFRRGTFVEFRHDFVEHNCSLRVDGRDYGICWENLPDLDCYPAVTLGKSTRIHCGTIGIQTAKIAKIAKM